jgi:hypothetical protein
MKRSPKARKKKDRQQDHRSDVGKQRKQHVARITRQDAIPAIASASKQAVKRDLARIIAHQRERDPKRFTGATPTVIHRDHEV